jgi:beta-glucosidase
VLHMGLAGQAGGLAAAELLTGAANPGGKLAESYPVHYEDVPSAGFYESDGRQAQYREGIYIGYRYYDKSGKAVCFPFGHGLSYTTFEYRDMRLSSGDLQAGEELTVSLAVRNTGERDGAEIVQLYVGSLEPGSYRAEKELRGFERIFLEAGQEQQVTFTLDSRAFACYDAAAKAWVVPAGAYGIYAAASSRDIRLQQQIYVHGAAPAPAAPAAWYTDLAGNVTQVDFECLLGRQVEPLKQAIKGEFTLASTMQDMRSSLLIRGVIKIFERIIGKFCGGIDYLNPHFKMMVESLLTSPMQSLVLTSAGMLSANMAEGLVHLANGRWLKGLIAFIPKKEKKK